MVKLLLMLMLCPFLVAGEEIYDPSANAEKDLIEAVARAKASDKHVLVVIGGNWCGWCKRLDKLMNEDVVITKVLSENYDLLHVNYSEENRNMGILKKLEYPQRFGFPVLVVLDADGNRLHTQNSGYLEEGKGHSSKRVAGFLKDWRPAALRASSYQ